MPDTPRGSNWKDATHAEVLCIHCGANFRDLERRGDEYFCTVCGRCFPAPSENDKGFLRSVRIKP